MAQKETANMLQPMYSILRFLLILAFLALVAGVALLVYQLPWWSWPMALALLLKLRPKVSHWWAHGTAAWETYLGLARAGMLEGNGVPVGLIECDATRTEGIKALFDGHLSARRAVEACLSAFQGKQKRPLQTVRLNRSHHVSIFAPTGAGKNVSIVEPFLFSSRESAIVIDVKGENCQLTSGHREVVFDQTIIRLDPWKLTTDTPACWNILDGIDPTDPETLDRIRGLAEAMVPKHPGEHDPHWREKAEKFIGGVIAAVVFCCEPSQRNLPMVAKILANKVLVENAITDLCNCRVHGGLVAQIGHEMNVSIARNQDGSWSSDNREIDGILSTASRFLTFLNTPAVQASTEATVNCALSALYSKQGATIYLIIPLHYLASHAALLRLWITALTQHAITRGIGNRRPVNVILDECATVMEGQGKALEQMLVVGRGYGLKVLAIFQAMSQLGKVLPPGQEGVVLSNTTQVFFGVNELQGANYVSNRLGKRTIIAKGWGTGKSGGWSCGTTSSLQGGSTSYSTNGGWSANENYQQMPRELLKPEEVCELPERVAIVLGAPGVRPIATWLTRYYEKAPKLGFGPVKALVNATCLCLFAGVIAAMSVAAFENGSFQGKGGWNGERPAAPYWGAPGSSGGDESWGAGVRQRSADGGSGLIPEQDAPGSGAGAERTDEDGRP